MNNDYYCPKCLIMPLPKLSIYCFCHKWRPIANDKEDAEPSIPFNSSTTVFLSVEECDRILEKKILLKKKRRKL